MNPELSTKYDWLISVAWYRCRIEPHSRLVRSSIWMNTRLTSFSTPGVRRQWRPSMPQTIRDVTWWMYKLLMQVGWYLMPPDVQAVRRRRAVRFLLGCASMGYAKSCKGVLALVENLVANQVITKPSSSLPGQTMRNVHYVQNYHLTVGTSNLQEYLLTQYLFQL